MIKNLTKAELLELREEVLSSSKLNYLEKIIPKKSAYSFLYDCNQGRLDKYALNYLGRKYTYSEFFYEIDTISKSFYEKGIRAGDNVAIAMLSTPESIFSFYALNKIGAVVHMINATHDKRAIEEDLKECNPKLIVVNDVFFDGKLKSITDKLEIKDIIVSSLDDSLPVGFIGDRIKFKLIKAIKSACNVMVDKTKCSNWQNFRKIGLESQIEIRPYYKEKAGVVVASTSGSSGKPKRPFMTNENLNAIPIQMGMTCDTFAPNDSILTTLPIWILYSLFNSIHEPLCLGVTVDLDPLFNSMKIHKRLEQYKFNHWNTVPSYIEDFVNDRKVKNMDISFLKSVTTGGDYRTPKLKKMAEDKFKANGSDIEVGQGYGASECGGCFGYSYERNMPAETVGKPLIGNKYKIIDIDTGKELGVNEIGEIYLYSPTMMLGYFNDTELTDQVLLEDVNGVKWYKTEDMGHFDEKGQLFIDGRIRRIELSKDENGSPAKVFPDRIKQIVSKHPSIEQCEVIMVPDKKRASVPVAYLVMKEECQFTNNTINEIKNLCISENLEKYAIPVEYKLIKELPKKPSLKIDYDKLQQIYSEESKINNKKMVKFKKISD